MLPTSLLITRRRKSSIRPVYAALNPSNVELVRVLVQTYAGHVGKTKGALEDAVNGLEDLGDDYRYVRGLAALLDRRCHLEPRTSIDPLTVRRLLFTAANQRGFPTSPHVRRTLIEQVAKELTITVEEVEAAFYADLEYEHILRAFTPIDPETLLKQYNLSLTQTLLFSAIELTFTTTGNWQRLFRQIKHLGLIYTVTRSDDAYQVKVDGPASLFKLNRRYGTSLAKLLPFILENQEWMVNAKIWSRRDRRRLYDFEVDSETHGPILTAQDPTASTTSAAGYDSQVEKDFAERFTALDTGWKLTREPEPIPVGRRVMIPDFRFEKGTLVVFLEVMGFWTPRYLEAKIEKLGHLRDVDMIVAANRDLACERLDKLQKNLKVIYYKRTIPLKPILAHLKTREDRLVQTQVSHLKQRVLSIPKPIMTTQDLADELGVLKLALMNALKDWKIPGYTVLGDWLVQDIHLIAIQKRLERRLSEGELNLLDAATVTGVSGEGTTTILKALGYAVEWRGIDPQSTRIRKMYPPKR